MEEQNHDPTAESTPLRATHLITMEVPDQFPEVLPKHIIVTDPNQSFLEEHLRRAPDKSALDRWVPFRLALMR